MLKLAVNQLCNNHIFLSTGGLVNDQLFTREGLQRYAKLPDIDVLRGQLVAVLNAAPSRTKSLLEHHQQTLSQNLDQYVKDNTEKS